MYLPVYEIHVFFQARPKGFAWLTGQ